MMRLRVLIMALPALLLLAASASGAELWDRAVEYYDEYGDLVPGRMYIRFEQYNGRGKLVSSEFSEIELVRGAAGEIEGRVVFASSDGEDVTDKRQDSPMATGMFGGEASEEESDSPFAGLQKSPFDPAEQDSVAVVDTGRSDLVDGVQARVHTFRHQTGPESLTIGTAWLSEESGSPLLLVASVEPLPGFIDSFEIVQRFATDAAGRWYMTRMEFNGEGNILFVRRRLESEFQFSEYFPPTQEQVD
jgi:hypothetical protein